MSRISVCNLQRKLAVNVAALQRSAERALELVKKFRQRKSTPLDDLEEISVLLISDRRMAGLHRRFLNQAGPTDVMTFDHGEIFVSVDTAQKNRRRFGLSLSREIALYIVHGLLHLHGFDDRRPADARKMERTQQKILDALN